MAEVPHRTQTGLNAAHPPFYASESDPTTTLGAHRVWLKPSTGVIKRRNAANTAWEDISIEGTSAGSAPSLADLSDVDVISTPPGDGEALVWDDTAGEWVPGTVAAGSLAASDVTYAGGTGMSATNVESAIDELATEKANDSALTAHIDDTADAHDATAISYAGGTGMSATHVEGAIDELATEKVDITRTISTTAPLTGGGDLSSNRTLAISAATESATGAIELATQAETNTGTDDARAVTPLKLKTNLDLHVNDTADAHDASAISVLDTAAQYTATNVEDALAEVLDEVQAHEADTTDAHDASAISFVPAGSVAATNVQAAIEEVASEAGGGGSAHTIKDEGSAMTQRANLNFIGAGVTVTDDAGNSETEVTIPGASAASESTAGVLEIATQAETDTGTDDTRAVTPLKLANYSGLGGGGTLTKVYAAQASAVSISASTYTTMTFTTTGEIDALNEFDPATGTFTAASTKRVHFIAFVTWASNATGYRAARFYKNGSQTRFALTIPPVNGDVTALEVVAYLDLTSGDTVQIRAVNPSTSGSAAINSDTGLTTFEAHGVP